MITLQEAKPGRGNSRSEIVTAVRLGARQGEPQIVPSSKGSIRHFNAPSSRLGGQGLKRGRNQCSPLFVGPPVEQRVSREVMVTEISSAEGHGGKARMCERGEARGRRKAGSDRVASRVAKWAESWRDSGGSRQLQNLAGLFRRLHSTRQLLWLSMKTKGSHSLLCAGRSWWCLRGWVFKARAVVASVHSRLPPYAITTLPKVTVQ